MPRFTFEYDKRLDDCLKLLGMQEAFIPYAADLTRIREQRDLYVSFVKHKSFIEVNEMGTTAAAVTSIGVGMVSFLASLASAAF